MPLSYRESRTEQILRDRLTRSPFGLSFFQLRRAVGFSTRCHEVALTLADLVEQNQLTLNYGCYWTLKSPVEAAPLPPGVSNQPETKDGPPVYGNPAFIGPVWEPAFALLLWKHELPVIQQYPAEGYYLDIALVSDDIRLDIEVDGRTTHCDRLGRRKVADVVRDARLRAAGWSIRRFWVSELMRDMDGCVEQVRSCWRQQTG